MPLATASQQRYSLSERAAAFGMAEEDLMRFRAIAAETAAALTAKYMPNAVQRPLQLQPPPPPPRPAAQLPMRWLSHLHADPCIPSDAHGAEGCPETSVEGGPDAGGAAAGLADVMVLSVPQDVVGTIIGRSGDAIRHIEAQSGTKLTFAKGGDAANGMRDILIMGERHKQDAARLLIEARVEKLLQSADEETVEFTVPQEHVGLVIGRSGENLKHIKQSTGVDITINKVSNDLGERIVYFEGSEEGVQAAKAMIRARVLEGYRRKGVFHEQLEAEFREVNRAGLRPQVCAGSVPGTYVPKIVGRNGENLRRIQESTGVEVTMQRIGGDHSACNVLFAGNPEGMSEAKAMIIRDIIEGFAQKGSRRSEEDVRFGEPVDVAAARATPGMMAAGLPDVGGGDGTGVPLEKRRRLEATGDACHQHLQAYGQPPPPPTMPPLHSEAGMMIVQGMAVMSPSGAGAGAICGSDAAAVAAIAAAGAGSGFVPPFLMEDGEVGDEDSEDEEEEDVGIPGLDD